MVRRVHVRKLQTGSIALDAAEAHHIRDVLRLTAGSPLELFDDAGNKATGLIRHVNAANVVVDVEAVESAGATRGCAVTVAAAVPKGDRADWMVEKLTELGVAKFIPLATQRSVVLPAGKNKIERWERIAIEAAKQSHRDGVMAIAPLTPLDVVIGSMGLGWFLSTDSQAGPVPGVVTNDLTLAIGPEGGWTIAEVEQMKAAGWLEVGLTHTILRVETAAVIAAGLVLCATGSRFTAVRSDSNSDLTLP